MREAVAELFDDSLRFLPWVESLAADVPPAARRLVRDVRREVENIDAISIQIETAASEYRAGCRTSHFATLKVLSVELAMAASRADAALKDSD